MNKTTVVGISVVALAVIAFASWTIWKMNITKGEIVLNNRYEAQFNVVETTLDNMRKTIMNQHSCTKEWADNFINVVTQQSEGRSGGMGIKVSRESESLGIPQDMYLKLANSIEGKLSEFKRSQDILTDVWQTHKNYCENPYHNWLGVSMISKTKKKPEMITSAVSKDAMGNKILDDNLM